MFQFFKNPFYKKKIKNYSTTLTPATQGVNKKRELSPDIRALMERVNNNDKINNEELNKLASFYFNTPKIEAGLYNLNKVMTDGMCFSIHHVTTVRDPQGELKDIHISLKDTVFENDLVITVSVKDFIEVFKKFEMKPI